MAKTKSNPKVDFFFNKTQPWQEEYNRLRKIVLNFPLTEELKWGQPCYASEGKNIVLIHGFKEYCALLFMKGALLTDPKRILIQQTENVQAARQIRFSNLKDVVEREPAIKAIIAQAIDVEKAGLKVNMKKTSEFKIVEEFKTKLKENSALKNAFYALTPGRQRAYLLYFAGAKQSQTRESRIEKCVKAILEGKGLSD